MMETSNQRAVSGRLNPNLLSAARTQPAVLPPDNSCNVRTHVRERAERAGGRAASVGRGNSVKLEMKWTLVISRDREDVTLMYNRPISIGSIHSGGRLAASSLEQNCEFQEKVRGGNSPPEVITTQGMSRAVAHHPSVSSLAR